MTSERRSYGVEIVMRTTQAHRRELVQTLEAMATPTSGADGPDSSVFEDTIEANRFLWIEWWARADEAEAALDSDRVRTLLAAIRVLGTLESVRRVNCVSRIDSTGFRRPVSVTESRDG